MPFIALVAAALSTKKAWFARKRAPKINGKMIQELLTKLFGSSYTSITGAWNFKSRDVEVSSCLSISFTAIITMLSDVSKHFLGISGTLLLMICVIITADFITGITKAYRDQRKLRRPIVCAAKGIRSAYKLGVYIVFLFCIRSLVNEYQGLWVSDLLKYIHIYITIHIFFWESFSVDENLSAMGIDLGLKSFLKSIFSNFQKQIKDKVNQE